MSNDTPKAHYLRVPFRTRRAYLRHLAFYYTRLGDSRVQLTVSDITEQTLDRLVPPDDNT
jgi:hypothetical protein